MKYYAIKKTETPCSPVIESIERGDYKTALGQLLDIVSWVTFQKNYIGLVSYDVTVNERYIRTEFETLEQLLAFVEGKQIYGETGELVDKEWFISTLKHSQFIPVITF